MSKVKAFSKKYWATICILIGIIAIYVYATESGIANPFLFPEAEAILKVFAGDKENMMLNLAASFKLMVPAVIISLLLALGLGTLLGLNEKLREALHPIIYAFSVVPSILLSPFALLLAPSFWAASLFLIVYSTVWATLFATITGIMTIDKRYLDKAATLELKGLKKFTKVILPAASPSILAGFVNSLRNTFVMLVYAEMTGAQFGMGYYVKKYSNFGMYDRTWAGFIFMVVILVIVMQLFEMLKKRLLKWTID